MRACLLECVGGKKGCMRVWRDWVVGVIIAISTDSLIETCRQFINVANILYFLVCMWVSVYKVCISVKKEEKSSFHSGHLVPWLLSIHSPSRRIIHIYFSFGYAEHNNWNWFKGNLFLLFFFFYTIQWSTDVLFFVHLLSLSSSN